MHKARSKRVIAYLASKVRVIDDLDSVRTIYEKFKTQVISDKSQTCFFGLHKKKE